MGLLERFEKQKATVSNVSDSRSCLFTHIDQVMSLMPSPYLLKLMVKSCWAALNVMMLLGF